MKLKINVAKLTQFIGAIALGVGTFSAIAADPPMVGQMAPDFTLNTLDGKMVSLKELTPKKPVVLVMLRGWPGYQCPICTRQVHDFVSQAGGFEGKAKVVMIYPGPADKLMEHAEEFLKDKQWPMEFTFLIDPDYSFTKAYGLRWDAKGETAYPSTFIIDSTGKVRFSKISHEHDGRLRAEEALKALEKIM